MLAMVPSGYLRDDGEFPAGMTAASRLCGGVARHLSVRSHSFWRNQARWSRGLLHTAVGHPTTGLSQDDQMYSVVFTAYRLPSKR